MRYRTIGKTDLKVSEIGFGTGDNAGLMTRGSRRQQVELIAHALELGINLFDSAPDYGRGAAEVNLGHALRELNAFDRAVIVTKIDVFPEDFERLPEKIEISIHDSLARLGRDSVDVMMIHNPCWGRRDASRRYWSALSPSDVIDLALPTLIKAKKAGKIRHIGINCDNSAEPEAVRKIFETREFSLINGVYHLANASAGMSAGSVSGVGNREGLFDNYAGLLDLALEFDVGVDIIRPLAGGALTASVAERGRDGLHELSQGWFRHAPEYSEPAVREGRRYLFLAREGNTLSQAAYRFILSHPAISSVVGGFGEKSHMDEAAAASDQGPLPADDLRRVLELQHKDVSEISRPV